MSESKEAPVTDFPRLVEGPCENCDRSGLLLEVLRQPTTPEREPKKVRLCAVCTAELRMQGWRQEAKE